MSKIFFLLPTAYVKVYLRCVICKASHLKHNKHHILKIVDIFMVVVLPSKCLESRN